MVNFNDFWQRTSTSHSITLLLNSLLLSSLFSFHSSLFSFLFSLSSFLFSLFSAIFRSFLFRSLLFRSLLFRSLLFRSLLFPLFSILFSLLQDAFYRLVYSHTEALNLLKKFYASKVTSSDRHLLYKLYIFNKNYLDAGILAVKQAYLQYSPYERQLQVEFQGQNKNLVDTQTQIQKDSKLRLLKEALQLFSQCRDLGQLFNFHLFC